MLGKLQWNTNGKDELSIVQMTQITVKRVEEEKGTHTLGTSVMTLGLHRPAQK